MGVPVKNLQLTRLDDGRQELHIELDEPYAGDALTWRGHLTIEALPPSKDEPVQYQLAMAGRDGRNGEPFAVIEFRRPPRDEPNLLAEAVAAAWR